MAGSSYKTRLGRAALLIFIVFACGCRPGEEGTPEGPALKLSLAVSPAPYSALVVVADEKGYFKKSGLEVSITSHPSGREALEAVCAGKAQVATVADIAFSAKAMEEPSIRVLASIATTVSSWIVARKDRNIKVPSDLGGKRIGFSPGTVSDYFLYSFLVTENIPLGEITAVELPPARQADAVVNGEVDAVSAFDPFSYEAKKLLGENSVTWESQNNLAYHWLLAAKEDLTRSPEPLKRLLRALIMAENFALADEEETRTMLSRKWGFDPAYLRESWPRTRLTVAFSQSIVTSLQNYVAWQMKKKGDTAGWPDVLNYVHTGILDAAAPDRVTIFR